MTPHAQIPYAGASPGAYCLARERLIWAEIQHTLPYPDRVFFGVGCTSNEGLPFDALAMPLAAIATGLVSDRQPLTVLIADAHAAMGACDARDATKRATTRVADIQRVGRALGQPVEVVLASDLVGRPNHNFARQLVDRWLADGDAGTVNRYNALAIGDSVYMAMNGHLKVGWTRYAQEQLAEGKGRSDEYNGTDRFAKAILPSFAAMYVRHGVTTDSKHPAAVPYSVHAEGVGTRLMLTGDGIGGFAKKLAMASPNRTAAILDHVERIVDAWELCVVPLNPGDAIGKAEQIVALVNAR